MYYVNGTYYNEQHSISFGNVGTKTDTVTGKTYEIFNATANTWSTWHLIPSSRISINQPTFATKMIEIPGMDGMLDLSTFLTGRMVYGQRQGSLDFLVDNGHEHWEAIRESMVRLLHGKRIKMVLQDDPTYYYDGIFTVGQWKTESSNSSVSITYQLDPYKMRINKEGAHDVIWDDFNFDKDYDYSVVMEPSISVDNVTKTYKIQAGDYPFTPSAKWSWGTVTVSFGGVTKRIESSGTVLLGKSVPGSNTLSVSGTGSVIIEWRGGSL